MIFIRVHFQILLVHLCVSVFTGSMIGWTEGVYKGLLFGVIYFSFMLIVYLYFYLKHKHKYGRNDLR